MPTSQYLQILFSICRPVIFTSSIRKFLDNGRFADVWRIRPVFYYAYALYKLKPYRRLRRRPNLEIPVTPIERTPFLSPRNVPLWVGVFLAAVFAGLILSAS